METLQTRTNYNYHPPKCYSATHSRTDVIMNKKPCYGNWSQKQLKVPVLFLCCLWVSHVQIAAGSELYGIVFL